MADSCESCETWEDLEDSGELDKRLKGKKESKQESKRQSNDSMGKENPTILKEDTSRTTYQPQVRILKRNSEQQNQAQRTNNTGQQQKGRWRPLEERAAAYAEARMRIFGQAESEAVGAEGEGDTSAVTLATGILMVTGNPMATGNPMVTGNPMATGNPMPTGNSNVTGNPMATTVPSTTDTRQQLQYADSNISRQMQTLKVNSDSVHIVRQPLGPDGSRGFVHR